MGNVQDLVKRAGKVECMRFVYAGKEQSSITKSEYSCQNIWDNVRVISCESV